MCDPTSSSPCYIVVFYVTNPVSEIAKSPFPLCRDMPLKCLERKLEMCQVRALGCCLFFEKRFE